MEARNPYRIPASNISKLARRAPTEPVPARARARDLCSLCSRTAQNISILRISILFRGLLLSSRFNFLPEKILTSHSLRIFGKRVLKNPSWHVYCDEIIVTRNKTSIFFLFIGFRFFDDIFFCYFVSFSKHKFNLSSSYFCTRVSQNKLRETDISQFFFRNCLLSQV